MNPLKHASKWRRAACIAAVAFLSASHPALADATIRQVFVYNGGANNEGHANDIFTGGAQGWIMQQMGLLGPQGQYPTVNGNNVESPAGTVRGTVLRDANNNIIGYQSADGKTRAYNIDTSATMRDAWNAVANNGTITVAKHGQTGGGGITLDGGRMYDGFRPTGGGGAGTGAGNPAGPYDLPGRPGANITINLNGCYTSHDPDGGTGSVTGSAGGVPGVGATSGNDGVIYKGPNIGLMGTDAQIAAAEAALNRCAERSGLRDENGDPVDGAGWAARQPMPRQHQAIADCIAGTGATFELTYEKSEQGDGGGCVADGSGCYYLPVQVVTPSNPSSGFLQYQIGPTHPPMMLQIQPTSLPPMTPIFMTAALGENAQLPPETLPGTYFLELRVYGPPQPLFFNPPAQLMMHFPPGQPMLGFFQVLPNGALQPYPAQIDPAQGILFTTLSRGGTYVGLRPAPPPPCDPDLNQDGNADQDDIVYLINVVGGGDNPTGIDPDFNRDGNVDQDDINALIGVVAGGPCP
jgi:hypothetical protein